VGSAAKAFISKHLVKNSQCRIRAEKKKVDNAQETTPLFIDPDFKVEYSEENLYLFYVSGNTALYDTLKDNVEALKEIDQQMNEANLVVAEFTSHVSVRSNVSWLISLEANSEYKQREE
jgi:hypothetical protein